MNALIGKKPKLILVVESDLFLLKSFQAVLEEAGYDVCAVASAEEALVFASRNDPDLIIADILLSGLNGFRFWERYKEKFSSRFTPFVFLSGLSEPDDLVLDHGKGVNNSLVKPIMPKMLIAKVNSVLHEREKLPESGFNWVLSEHSLTDILQFCKNNNLEGKVLAHQDENCIDLLFEREKLVEVGEEVGMDLTYLHEIKNGHFRIIASSPSSQEINPKGNKSAVESRSQTGGRTPEGGGLLSAIPVGAKSVDIQTEISFHPECCIISTAYYNGRVLLTRKNPFPKSIMSHKAKEMSSEQHHAIEEEIRRRILSHQNKADEKQEKNEDLFIRGHDAFNKGAYETALEDWEKALKEEADSLFLAIHIQLAKEKLKARSRL